MLESYGERADTVRPYNGEGKIIVIAKRRLWQSTIPYKRRDVGIAPYNAKGIKINVIPTEGREWSVSQFGTWQSVAPTSGTVKTVPYGGCGRFRLRI